jgi:hypothetical protein
MIFKNNFGIRCCLDVFAVKKVFSGREPVGIRPSSVMG